MILSSFIFVIDHLPVQRPAAEISRNWEGKELFAPSWSMEYDEQGILICVFIFPRLPFV